MNKDDTQIREAFQIFYHCRGVVVNTPDLHLTGDPGSIPGGRWWLLWCSPWLALIQVARPAWGGNQVLLACKSWGSKVLTTNNMSYILTNPPPHVSAHISAFVVDLITPKNKKYYNIFCLYLSNVLLKY